MKMLTKERILRLFFWKSDSDYKNISLRITKYLTVFVVIAFFANAFYYGYETHHTIIRADLWRFIELYLMPYYNGTFELKMLWSDHHPNPISAILFILSAEYFDLTVSLYYYVGIISKIFFMAFFLYLMDKSIERKSPLLYLIMMLVVSIFFSLKSHAEYTTSLVTFGNFWMLLSLIVLYFVDKVLKKNSNIHLTIVFLFLTIFIMGTKDLATIFLGSIVGSILLILLNTKEYNATKKLDKNLRGYLPKW